MERRVISTKMQEEDIKIESSLRPQSLKDYIGQEKAKENLKKLDAAKTYEDELTEAINRQLREDSIAAAKKNGMKK